jgi:Fe-S cluster assembly iron-binding protein IscA
MSIAITERARASFEAERRRQGKPDLGIQVNFLYGCGGAGFRVVFTEEPQGSHVGSAEGIRIALDAETQARLRGGVIDWEDGEGAGFFLRHPDAALVEFC